jgi:hypothetical protein
MTIFFRLLAHQEKAEPLEAAIAAANEGKLMPRIAHALDPSTLLQIPGAPFAYWAGNRLTHKFAMLPQFEGDGRRARQGLATADDPRFVRCWWEVPSQAKLTGTQLTRPSEFREQTFEGKKWVPFAKGGEYSPYFCDLHLAVNWERDGQQIRSFINPETGRLKSRPQNTGLYFLPGLTWPLRTTSNFGLSIMSGGCIFSHKGPAAFLEGDLKYAALGILSSQPYQWLIELRMPAAGETQSGTPARSYEVGIIQRLPWPEDSAADVCWFTETVGALVRSAREPYTLDETCAVFVRPFYIIGDMIRTLALAWQRHWEERAVRMVEQAGAVDVRVAGLLGVTADEREDVFGPDAASLCALPDEELPPEFDADYQADLHAIIRRELREAGGNRRLAVKSFYASRHLEVLAHVWNVRPSRIARTACERGLLPYNLEREIAERAISYAVGCAFGRWDVRFATGARPLPALGDPFDPLPACPPGALTGPDGLPAHEAPADYPLRISSDGILLDDAGADGTSPHPDDIVRRVREVLDVLWGERAAAIEREACGLLGLRPNQDLREYFRNPRRFYTDHMDRYTKSGRKAPIYWLLQSEQRSYGLWLYYPKLTRDTLPRALAVHVRPKVVEQTSFLRELRKKFEAEREGLPRKERTAREGALEVQESLVTELTRFRDSLERVVTAGYEPDLDDGVLLNIAPLHEFTPWDGATEAWNELLAGEHVWSTLARRLRERGVVKNG